MTDTHRKKQIRFIINPISGVYSKKIVERLIKRHIQTDIIAYEIVYSMYPGHATELSSEAASEKFDAVVAVGGDGTINEVARALKNTDTALGIIPAGSGNGLARGLNIPLRKAAAVRMINDFNTTKMDTATINNTFFVNIAGIGFDAEVAKLFEIVSKRGFWPYFNIIFRKFFNFKPHTFTLVVNGKREVRKCMMISFANASQFGFQTIIAPHARVDDGLIDVCRLSMLPWYKVPGLLLRIYTKGADKSPYIDIEKAASLEVYAHDKVPAHIDGDPAAPAKKFTVKVFRKNLKIIVPEL